MIEQKEQKKGDVDKLPPPPIYCHLTTHRQCYQSGCCSVMAVLQEPFLFIVLSLGMTLCRFCYHLARFLAVHAQMDDIVEGVLSLK
jgi:hypothetical protein